MPFIAQHVTDARRGTLPQKAPHGVAPSTAGSHPGGLQAMPRHVWRGAAQGCLPLVLLAPMAAGWLRAQEAGRLEEVLQALVNPSDEALWNLMTACSNQSERAGERASGHGLRWVQYVRAGAGGGKKGGGGGGGGRALRDTL